MRNRTLLSAVAAGAVAAAGCGHHARKCCRPAPPTYLPPAPGGTAAPGAWLGAPTGPGGTNIPPASVPTAPGTTLPPPDSVQGSFFTPQPARPGLPPPPARSYAPPPPAAVPPLFGNTLPSQSGFGNGLPPKPGTATPPPAYAQNDPLLNPTRPGRPAPEVLLPEQPPSRSQSPQRGGYLGDPVEPKKAPTTEPPLAKPSPPSPPPAGGAVTGVPGFVRVGADRASGRKPDVDGFESLRANGFKTVVYLHAPGTEAVVDQLRDVAERKGLRVVPIEVSKETLEGGQAVEAFNRAVGDRANLPVFVCDDNGTRNGVLWYAYFRKVDGETHDAARLKARPLGMNEDSDLWLALKAYLNRP